MSTRRPITAVVLALSLAACGGAAPTAEPTATPTLAPTPTQAPTPSPTATPAPTPTPSPTSDALVEEFLRQVTARQSVEGTVSGDMTFGATSLAINGELVATESGDSSTILLLTLPDGSIQVSESITAGGREYRATAEGPFVDEGPRDPNQQGIASFLRTLARLEDQGPETIDGRTLHRLVPPADVELDPAALGLDPEQFADARVNVEFYAQPDGTPARMVALAEWTQDFGGQSVPAALRYVIDFDNFGGDVAVTPPVDAWQRFQSTAHAISVGHPQEWAVTPAGFAIEYDAIDSEFNDRLLIISVPGPGDLVTSTDEFVAGLIESFDAEIDETTQTTIAGQPALLLSLTPAEGNARVYVATTASAERFHALSLVYQEDPGTQGLDLLEAFLTTVKLGN
jgi:hypothetical protein